jgi:hypothetical protein
LDGREEEHLMKMNTGSIVGIVGGLLIIIGVVLPWMSDDIGNSISGLTAGISVLGIVLILFGVLGLVMLIPGKRGLAIGSIVFGALALLLYLAMLGLSSILTSMASGLGASVSVGFGLYIGFIGSILLIVGAIVARSQLKSVAPAPPVAPPAPPQA